MKGYLILAGVDSYEDGSKLPGCVDDLFNVADVCNNNYNIGGWEVYLLNNRRCTAAKIKAAVHEVAQLAKPGDHIWIHNSSHGSVMPYQGRKHHVTLPFNFNWNVPETIMFDFDWQELLKLFVEGTIPVFTTDSCYATGLFSRGISNQLLASTRRTVPRYLPAPQKYQDQLLTCAALHPRGIIGNLIDISAGFGCGPDQTSDSVMPFKGPAYGAYTKYLCDSLRAKPVCTFVDAHVQTNNFLAEQGHTQRSTWDGAQVKNLLFEGKVSI